MNELPGDLKFLRSHEWARVDDNGRVTVGISEHAQGQLGDLVYVELPNVGDHVDQNGSCAVVESVKAASDIYAPVSGEVVEANAALTDSPGDVNAEPMGKGWFFKMTLSDKGEFAKLMDAAAYAKFVEGL